MEIDIYGEEAWQYMNSNFSHVKGLYLDHAGSTLYSKSLIEHSLAELTQNCFGNPHSRNTPSRLTTDLIDQTRIELLNFFQADPNQYTLLFTSGATDSLRLVAESFQFSSMSSHSYDCGSFIYLKESHTSVIGMREYFKRNVPCYALPSDDISTYFNLESHSGIHEKVHIKDNLASSVYQEKKVETEIAKESEKTLATANSLFVFPAQCNFSGFKYPLELISYSQQGGLSDISRDLCLNKELLNKKEKSKKVWFCLLDAASYVGTNQLDLSVWQPDMVAISFYKMFGYPTGLGALIVHQRANHVLQKKYVGGGTVEIVSSSRDFHVARHVLQEKFENGTVNFLSILALRHGMRELKNLVLTMDNVSIHTFRLGQLLYVSLCQLKHANGKSLVKIYSHTEFTDRQRQGAIVTFNLMAESGDYIGYAYVEKILSLYDVHVRTGCFCNPAACQRFLELSEEDLCSHYMSGHKCGDENDLIHGRPTGAVRVSFGYMSQRKDVIQFLTILRQCFLQDNVAPRKGTAEKLLEPVRQNRTYFELIGIHVYPIKSCGGFSPKTWPISKSGLLYDRHWVIVNDAGIALTQKREPKLCMIRPSIDLERNKLILQYYGTELSISMDINDHHTTLDGNHGMNLRKICGKIMHLDDCESAVNQWLSEVIGRPALKLLRCSILDSSLVNTSSFLLLNYSSVNSLKEQLKNTDFELSSTEEYLTRFRGNFVVEGANAFEEDGWEKVKIGPYIFQNVGACFRCQMVCIDQNTAIRSREALTVLANTRGKKMPFGICLEMCSNASGAQVVEIGYPVSLDTSDVKFT
ncbi:Molybdenum cofactor sulfurase [Daphnia magna]|uniref:Molybdenum cofactor sulfurase n=1 Tax=Daphnia magna TaxID=35525 RepID=A0A162T2T1_9CRUS|nr:Molybdenum cofactor sulfurase [Daphnia magna]